MRATRNILLGAALGTALALPTLLIAPDCLSREASAAQIVAARSWVEVQAVSSFRFGAGVLRWVAHQAGGH